MPAIGNTLDAINTYANKAYGAIDTITKEQKVKKINEIITQHFTINDLKLYTQEVAIAMLQNPAVQNAIKEQKDNKDPSKLQQAQEAYNGFKKDIDTKLDLLKQEAIGIDEVDVDFRMIAIMSLEHVGTFVEMLCRLDEDQSGMSILPRDKDLIQFINAQVLSETDNIQDQPLQISQEEFKEGEVAEIQQNAPQFKPHNKKCTIFSVTDIQYDNPLLNNKEILNEALNKYSLSQILDLSLNVNPELINNAIETGDSQLVLAGLMSVDQYNDLI